MRADAAIGAQHDALANDGVRADPTPRADFSAGTNQREGTDFGAGLDLGINRNYGGQMYPGHNRGEGIKKCGYASPGDVGLAYGNRHGARGDLLDHLGMHDD